jgi:hypothetical protein
MERRNFIFSLGLIPFTRTFLNQLETIQTNTPHQIKPIEGSWFEFQHHNEAEGKYWNQILAQFTDREWKEKVKEIAQTGIRYLVLLDVAIHDKSFYPSRLLPSHAHMACEDPLEAVLSAADQYGIKFFISNGFYGDWTNPVFLMQDKQVNRLRLQAMNEVAERYAHHESFYGWYYPNETGIPEYYEDVFINYVNGSSAEAYKLTPKAKTLIAPYGTEHVKADDRYAKQLEQLNVDYIAYQDEVGVEKSTPDQTGRYFERLYQVHQKAAKARLWADVEVFCFEGEVYHSALLPAPPERVIRQLEAISPFVEKILIYQYTGMINRPESPVFAGHPDSVKLYRQLVNRRYLK